MRYEIDFIGIDEPTGNADAIAFRWLDAQTRNYKIGVYDGGTMAYGEALKNHLNRYYFPNNYGEKIIDFIVCSHTDQDHASGLKKILEEYTVKKLYMNIPWHYIDYLFDRRDDKRMTRLTLERELKETYKYISDLEEIALQKHIPIYTAFQGTNIENTFTILSPSKEFFLKLLVESRKTPLEEASSEGLLGGLAKVATEAFAQVLELWDIETLRENVSTSAENEMSVILLGNMEEEAFLLTGDAGIRALKQGIEYLDQEYWQLKDSIKLMQIPHHGGRHNVSPSILNMLVGDILECDQTRNICAVASVGKGTDHPRKMVVNAYIRRGARVYTTNGSSFRHHKNMASRPGWSAAQAVTFYQNVESWDE